MTFTVGETPLHRLAIFDALKESFYRFRANRLPKHLPTPRNPAESIRGVCASLCPAALDSAVLR